MFVSESHISQLLDLLLFEGSGVGEFLGPGSIGSTRGILGLFFEFIDVGLVLFGDDGVLRIIWLGAAHEGLDGEEGGSDGEGRAPLALEDVEANSPGHGRHVRVPDFCVEFHLGVRGREYFWGLIWVGTWDLNVDEEFALFVGRILLRIRGSGLTAPLIVAFQWKRLSLIRRTFTSG